MVEAAGNRAPTWNGRKSCVAVSALARPPAAATSRRSPRTAKSIPAVLRGDRQGRRTRYIAIADGGDLLSFAKVGLAAGTYMDSGALGLLLGVGVPFGVAAALAFPGRQVISVQRRRGVRHQRHGDPRHRRTPWRKGCG